MYTTLETSEVGMLNENRCWQAVVRRDRGEDGHFYFGVTTTGIFCRPSCAARRPLRKNVRFFETAEEAERGGLRPCLRCRPTDAREDGLVDRMKQLCDYIRRECDSGESLTLDSLAQRAEMSPSRLRRLFREIVGVSPRQFVETCRFEKLKQGLRSGDEVTRAIYDAGFASSSRVYEQVDSQLGMTPSKYRDSGRGVGVSYAFADTSVGLLLVGATDRGLCFVQFGESKRELVEALQRELPQANIEETSASGTEQLDLWMDALRRHLDGEQPHLDLPVDVRATAFRHRVWRYLQSIPRGETRSYSEVAQAIGKPRAVRAVASACAANSVAIVIPCHRVIRANGDLGGFRWGMERKQQLLESEQA